MRIAQVAPLFESVPPRMYGGTERIVSYVTEGLVERGHDVTLYASADSVTAAKLRPCAPEALRLSGRGDPLAAHLLQIEHVAQRAHEFDVIHFHVDWLHFPISRRIDTPSLTTLHGRLDHEAYGELYDEFCDRPVVSISAAQRGPLPQACWVGTVHHGLPPDLHRPIDADREYLAFLGRVSPEKGLDRAIDIAVGAGLPLRVGAKVDADDRAYFEREIRHLLSHPLVTFVGEIGDDEKSDFLGRAKALLFPIEWPEPFGLVMIEAFACGTPVIAYPFGSVSEIVEPGVTGWVVSDIDEAIACVDRIDMIDRAGVRAAFERRFTADRMVDDYVEIYETLAVPTARPMRIVPAARPAHPM
jgi:glycosyltransferase involved in cell wall biosynthesis